MSSHPYPKTQPTGTTASAPQPIVALDVPTLEEALALADRLPGADFFKVGLQLFTAAGPEVIRRLRERGHRVFLDLKLHDIPNTVAGAVASAVALEVELLTVHASGGPAMLAAAARAAREHGGPGLLGVTILTSLDAAELSRAWGRPGLDPAAEVVRLAELARDAGLHGVVTSLHEVAAIREAVGDGLAMLTPGIRLPGDAAGDQARIGTPADAARLGVRYIVLGRTVTAAADPAAAYQRALQALETER